MNTETFMVCLMIGVIGSACLFFVCHSCYNLSRINRRVQAQAKREAEREARITNAPPVPLIRWGHGMTLSGPPVSSVTAEVQTDDDPMEHRRTQVDNNRFASPPLAVLATGEARVATIKPLQRCFMLHSVVLAATADALEAVLLEAAELRKLKHPGV